MKCNQKKCGATIFFVGLAAGAAYGLFFAQESGQKLRAKLKKSKTPVRDLLLETVDAKEEFYTLMFKKVRELLK